jgi:curved DNA-binding protein CbpA
MRLGDEAEGDDRVPRLTPGCDPSALELNKMEGYLLSRIDGHTSCSQLRQLGGVPPHEVERCLEGWLKKGLIEFEPGGAPSSDGAPGEAGLQIDPGLDLSVELQHKVIAFASGLDRPYHEILGVARDADIKTIKKAYFGLSRLYHPDRYFRRNLGPYAAEVERCFKKLLEAYELLSDPATRKEIQDQAPPPPPMGESPAAAVARGPSALEMRRRLRRRRDQLTGHRRIRDERKRKAKSFFEAGMAAFGKERWLEAAGSVRLALAFDPGQEVYKERFVEVQRKANEERAQALILRADDALELRDYQEALELLEEAVHCRPYDAELSYRAGRLAWQALGDLRKAKDLATGACELEPENSTYRRTLGLIYASAGLASNARRELQAATKLDPGDKEAKAALKAL